MVRLCACMAALPAQLSLWTRWYDVVTERAAFHPSRDHVEILWKMSREKRLRVWQEVGRHDALEVLELGDCHDMEDGEMRDMVTLLVLPGCPASVRVLYLGFMWKLTDASIQTLAEAGCGESLESLRLACEFLLFCVP